MLTNQLLCAIMHNVDKSTSRKGIQMVRIVIDSTIDVTSAVANRVDIIPLTVNFGQTEYKDGIDITKKEFYEKLVECDTLPTTSQATPDAFLGVFEKIASEGDSAVVITLSQKLSGTYQSACIAASEYQGKIFVVDSGSTAIGSGILVEYALECVDKGMDAQAVAKTVESVRSKVLVIAMLDTLEYLKKGGRISPTVAFAGGLLMIKPVVCIDDGEIKILGKARGSKAANNLLVTEIEKAGGVDFSMPLLLGYTGLTDVLLKKYIDDSSALWKHSRAELEAAQIGSVIGTHAGPGAVAVAFFKNE